MYNVNTNFFDENGVDLGKKLVSKDYLMSYYPDVANSITTPELWVWGENQRGTVLGLGGDPGHKSTPVTTIAGGANWKQVKLEGEMALAIKTDGTLWGWGHDFYGRFGGQSGSPNGEFDRPTQLGTATNWKQVTHGGSYTTLAIKTDGTLWAWGGNQYGQLGDNTTVNRSTPVQIGISTNWKQVSIGGESSSAIKTDGSLWVWGRNDFGYLGIGTTSGPILTPVTTFSGGNDWKVVSATSYGFLALKTNGELWVWGSDPMYLGINTGTGARLTPVTTFAGGNNWSTISGGVGSAGIKTDGTLWHWGPDNRFLAINGGGARSTPVTTFAGGSNWKTVYCGAENMFAIKTDGTLWGWGRDYRGRLANRQEDPSGYIRTPVTTFLGGNNWKSVGGFAAIRSIDTV